ncbi:type I restriction-modification system subunit M N-terminal domain-containing protein [Pseudolactococcus reticulitermitis]|uniref:N6 adenine-specific DNA methyltransferase N-terminal domain-containing protein n=1 Tax=Pseudolactococcus reticulitermitis TaxID=2025039 RepID=A0A224WZW8_9LACT|nr:type I restriction-modification system subunit M N-terminal domain-containing protein [Lactococcus reticulitermitis]GAX47579.1 hypothetical protein RsY01_1179 [Lactococcus reticulitermitis]
MNNSKLPIFQSNDINISNEVNMVWSIANTLRGAYRADKYRDVIIPLFVIARLEAALLPTKQSVVEAYAKNQNTPKQVLESISGYKYYNASKFTLKNLLDEPDNIKTNFESYLEGYSNRVQDILKSLNLAPKSI